MERHDPTAVRRARRIARLVAAIVGALAGITYAAYVVPNSDGLLNGSRAIAAAALGVLGLLGIVSGYVLGPALSVDPYLWVERLLDSAAPGELLGGVIGLLVALLASALISVPLFHLPEGIGLIVSLAVTAVAVYLGVSAGTRRRADILRVVNAAGAHGAATPAAVSAAVSLDPAPAPLGAPAVVDTSALIDGRILDIARAGFLPGRLIIAHFVLEELQRVADAGDPARRAKGRRGLETVERLQQLGDPECEIVEAEFPGVSEVDSRLLRLARIRGASLLTTDYMLNRLAHIEGMRVLNVNDLALAVKPVVSAGETMDITIVKPGKEPHQGVGYLPDGTMVVVENASTHIDESVTVTVTSVIQTPAGRLIFGLLPSTGAPAEEPRPVRTRGSRSRAANR